MAWLSDEGTIERYTFPISSRSFRSVSKRTTSMLKGEITSPVNLPDQCRFLKRCDVCQACCETGKNPELKEVSPGHFVLRKENTK